MLAAPRRLPLAVLAVLVLGLVLGAPAAGAASSGNPVIADCYAHNALTHHYSLAQLESAQQALPADVREYSDCAQIIQRQILVQEGKLKAGSPTGSTSGGSGLPTVVIVVIVVLLLAAAGLGAVALRRRQQP